MAMKPPIGAGQGNPRQKRPKTFVVVGMAVSWETEAVIIGQGFL